MNLEISKIANLPTAYGDFKIQSFKQNDKESLWDDFLTLEEAMCWYEKMVKSYVKEVL